MTHTCINFIYKIAIFIYNNVDFSWYMHMLPYWFYQVYSSCFVGTWTAVAFNIKFSKKRFWYHFTFYIISLYQCSDFFVREIDQCPCVIYKQTNQSRQRKYWKLFRNRLTRDTRYLVEDEKISRYIQAKWQVQEAAWSTKYISNIPETLILIGLSINYYLEMNIFTWGHDLLKDSRVSF